ncbi:hypothetical protein IKF33_01700 [Candidatus Saccharibacteria bacterium]|nr:hypothetical protein [Candidatus Saccharibacteria bacterium]
MLSKRITISTVSAAVIGASFCGVDAFAANPYNIDYSAAGSQLGSDNVQIEPDLVSGLTPLMKVTGVSQVFKPQNKWASGYINSQIDGCIPAKYVTISKSNSIEAVDNIGYTVKQGPYTATIDFKKAIIDGESANNFAIGVATNPATSVIWGGWQIYSDSTCSQAVPNVGQLTVPDDTKMFIETNIKLYREGNESVFKANDLFFGLTDIDASQSYKILNSGNELSPSNMYAKNAAALQPTDSDLRNIYASNGNYIYAQYNSQGSFAIDSGSNIYVKLNGNTQEQGLNLVFGFVGHAASGVAYYAKQFNVTYVSDENGEISDITEEDIVSGNHPSGSESTPNEDYNFTYWIANVDVELQDGTVIKAGDPITSEQVKDVVVTQNIEFTAIHKTVESPEPVAVPNTGAPTGEMNAVVIPAFVAGAILGTACLIRFLNRFDYKKVDFKK